MYCSGRREAEQRPVQIRLSSFSRDAVPTHDAEPQFRDLLFRRAEPVYHAFDILWDEHARSDDEEEMRRFRNGEDTRYLPLIDRKLRLRRVVPKRGERLLYCDHIETDGEQLFRLVCEKDRLVAVPYSEIKAKLGHCVYFFPVRTFAHLFFAAALIRTIPAAEM